MIKRLKNVCISIFDPAKRKWEKMSNMSVLLRDDLVYVVKAEPFSHAIMKKLEENEDFKKLQDRSKKQDMTTQCFKEMLDQCIISEELQGIIYSGNVLWKVEREEHPFDKMGGDIEG